MTHILNMSHIGYPCLIVTHSMQADSALWGSLWRVPYSGHAVTMTGCVLRGLTVDWPLSYLKPCSLTQLCHLCEHQSIRASEHQSIRASWSYASSFWK